MYKKGDLYNDYLYYYVHNRSIFTNIDENIGQESFAKKTDGSLQKRSYNRIVKARKVLHRHFNRTTYTSNNNIKIREKFSCKWLTWAKTGFWSSSHFGRIYLEFGHILHCFFVKKKKQSVLWKRVFFLRHPVGFGN